jgi:hypothetical protein
MTTTHTPGPWVTTGLNGGMEAVETAPGLHAEEQRTVALCPYPQPGEAAYDDMLRRNPGEVRANAALIAEAQKAIDAANLGL